MRDALRTSGVVTNQVNCYYLVLGATLAFRRATFHDGKLQRETQEGTFRSNPERNNCSFLSGGNNYNQRVGKYPPLLSLFYGLSP